MSDHVERIECFVLRLPREEAYLGALGPGERANDKGYFVRGRNGTVYPIFDRSVLVRATTNSGAVGWGETYGIVAPGAPVAIIEDLLADFVIGRDPFDAAAVHDALYDLMRVRGYTGGFYMDALAAVDIALWDLAGKLRDKPVAALLGEVVRDTCPAYVSGLPRPTLPERADLAAEWVGRGFGALKFAAAVAHDGIVDEMLELRRRLGEAVDIAVDMHWAHEADEAIALIRAMEPARPWFAEAPVKPEDPEAQAAVARSVATPIALGEEWRTVWDARPRLERGAMAIMQPEMGHVGITQFMRMARLARAHGCSVIPHASIGVGVFLAASLQAAAVVPDLPSHEFQHSVMLENNVWLDRPLVCEAGRYAIPQGPGLGVAPNDDAIALMRNG